MSFAICKPIIIHSQLVLVTLMAMWTNYSVFQVGCPEGIQQRLLVQTRDNSHFLSSSGQLCSGEILWLLDFGGLQGCRKVVKSGGGNISDYVLLVVPYTSRGVWGHAPQKKLALRQLLV